MNVALQKGFGELLGKNKRRSKKAGSFLFNRYLFDMLETISRFQSGLHHMDSWALVFLPRTQPEIMDLIPPPTSSTQRVPTFRQIPQIQCRRFAHPKLENRSNSSRLAKAEDLGSCMLVVSCGLLRYDELLGAGRVDPGLMGVENLSLITSKKNIFVFALSPSGSRAGSNDPSGHPLCQQAPTE
eukprot:746491-Hanusia_phi.AAC.1